MVRKRNEGFGPDESSDAAVLAVLEKAGDEGLSVDEVLFALGGETGRSALRSQLKRLCVSGKVVRADGDLYIALSARPAHEGRLAWRDRAYVLEGEDGADIATLEPEFLGGAIAGDRVEVRLLGDEGRSLPSAEVVQLIESAPRQFTAPATWLRGIWLAQTPFGLEPVAIGMGGRRDLPEGRPVHVRLTGERKRFPQLRLFPRRMLVGEVGVAPAQHERTGRAAVLDRVAATTREARFPLTATGLLDRVAATREVDLPFPPDAFAIAEAARAPERIDAGLDDLTGEPLVTIDGADAKDFDDAVSARIDGANIELLVAIADVSAYVPEDSALDVEAKRRGCSVYLPGRVYPMLPPILSDDVCSLRPDVLRRCTWVRMRLAPDGAVVHYDAGFGVMKSRARLTYERVQRALDGTEPMSDPTIAESLAALEQVRQRRYALRVERGMLDLDLPETKSALTRDGIGVESMIAAERLTAHRLIEECMLVANETIADLLASQGWPAIRRVHGEPSAERLDSLRTLLEVLEIDAHVSGAMTAADLNGLLAMLADDPRSQVLSWRVLRTLPRATYSVGDDSHFGVGARRYLHFTSPIRRYPDLEVHRVLRRALAEKRPAKTALGAVTRRLEESALASNLGEVRATESERDAARALGALMMRERIGHRFDAVVTDITRFGVFIMIDTPRVDGLILFSGLGRERFEVVEEGILLEGLETGRRLVLGQQLVVRCTSVDLLKGRVGFEAEEWGGRRLPRKGRSKPKQGGRPGKSPGAVPKRRR